ncbi:WecB/TagA/CpsF family glycosyltransferase [Photobacterium aphoticum]|uniref:UDP-N-acetyl-D-mannosaminuronic acid transferase n=1 Tax=Photobacterium aphoticum TaxID=754436 RepID=A0A0J1GGL3_9GAMM|nr:WecB/TagA/CpsF family glycosyltransferase [Photobacterium aphoticum]KLU98867.1 hypothetical protein ABT58_20190 [Photobacterium aphoticum]PSU56693.1 hypothetical protein C9I90_12230 [Photobacterium aphoticum]GHA38860.1 UDP-N-acetyl-D-mannosaminuronic acid transferase [Photobacterium aphoticum]
MNNTIPSKHSINDLPITCFNEINQVVSYISNNYITPQKPGSAIAINPEKIVTSYQDTQTKDMLGKASFLYPDGIGVVKLLQKKTGYNISRIPGCELWEHLMRYAGQNNTPVFLLGATNSVVNQTVNKLKDELNLNISDFHDGYFTDEDEMVERIRQSGAKIVTVALGSPRQEYFIEKCINADINAFFMGVGGTYNVYTGNVKRAPQSWCKLNLEWLYRLLSEPTRIGRQIKLLKFVQLAVQNKI